MRQSTAAFAVIIRKSNDEVEWLLLWNPGWQVLRLVGSHKRPDESFCDCCARKVSEELGLTLGHKFAVGPDRIGDHLEYTAVSGRTGELTAYEVEVFPVRLLSPGAERRVVTNPAHAWASEREIRALRTHDARPISSSVRDQLRRIGAISGAE